MVAAYIIAEQSQVPGLLVMGNPKNCAREFQIARHSGPRYIRVFSDNADPRFSASRCAYREEGFGRREEFLQALENRSKDFLQCKTIVLFLIRYQSWHGDTVELKFDDAGKVASVGPLEFAKF